MIIDALSVYNVKMLDIEFKTSIWHLSNVVISISTLYIEI